MNKALSIFVLSFLMIGFCTVFVSAVNTNVTIPWDVVSGNDSSSPAWAGIKITTNVNNLELTGYYLKDECSQNIKVVVANSSQQIICKFDSNSSTICNLPYAGDYFVYSGNDGDIYERCYGNTINDTIESQYFNFSTAVTDVILNNPSIGDTLDWKQYGVQQLSAGNVLRNILSLQINNDSISIPVVNNNYNLSDGLVSYYDMNNNNVDGTTLVDVVGNNNCTINGAVMGNAGILAQGATFSNSTDNINCGNIFNYNTISLSFWANSSEWTTMFSFPIAKDNDAGSRAWFAEDFGITPPTMALSYYNPQGLSTTMYRSGTGNLLNDDGKMHYFVFVIDASTSKMKYYEDGVLYNEWYGNSGGIRTDSNTPILIGNRYSAPDSFKGTMDEVGFWNRPLKDIEVSALYNNGLGNVYPFNNTVSVCVPNWSCSSFDVCVPNNVSACLNVTDINMCGNIFNSSISDYNNNSCGYIPPTNNDSSIFHNLIAKIFAVILPILFVMKIFYDINYNKKEFNTKYFVETIIIAVIIGVLMTMLLLI